LGFSGLTLELLFMNYAISGVHPRRRAVRVMMMAVMDVKLHLHEPTAGEAIRQGHRSQIRAVFSIVTITITDNDPQSERWGFRNRRNPL
jgi:hypothetical protein